jgi:tetratricopeptide (TPR) repeat protein
VDAYSLGDAARILGVSPARLRYWGRTALLAPSDGEASRSAFAFRDLVCARALLELRQKGVSFARIRHGIEAVRRTLPELERPIGALRVWHPGSRRLVIRHQDVLVEPGGQMVFDFGDAPHAGVAPLEPCVPGQPPPASAHSWFERGCQLDSDPDRYAEAAEAYHRAIELDPQFADAHCNLGTLHYAEGRKAAARDCYERAIALEPRHLEAHLNHGILLEEEERYEAALRHYKRAVEAAPLAADAHASVALLYEKLGLRRRARHHWRRYLQLAPRGAWSEVARRRLAE